VRESRTHRSTRRELETGHGLGTAAPAEKCVDSAGPIRPLRQLSTLLIRGAETEHGFGTAASARNACTVPTVAATAPALDSTPNPCRVSTAAKGCMLYVGMHAEDEVHGEYPANIALMPGAIKVDGVAHCPSLAHEAANYLVRFPHVKTQAQQCGKDLVAFTSAHGKDILVGIGIAYAIRGGIILYRHPAASKNT